MSLPHEQAYFCLGWATSCSIVLSASCSMGCQLAGVPRQKCTQRAEYARACLPSGLRAHGIVARPACAILGTQSLRPKDEGDEHCSAPNEPSPAFSRAPHCGYGRGLLARSEVYSPMPFSTKKVQTSVTRLQGAAYCCHQAAVGLQATSKALKRICGPPEAISSRLCQTAGDHMRSVISVLMSSNFWPFCKSLVHPVTLSAGLCIESPRANLLLALLVQAAGADTQRRESIAEGQTGAEPQRQRL